MLSILASVGVAYSIYRLQRKQEEIENRRVNNHLKGALFNTLFLGVQQVHSYAKANRFDEQVESFRTVRILERHYFMLVELTNTSITQEESEALYFLLSDLEMINNYENEGAFIEVHEASDALAEKVFISEYFHFIKQTGQPKHLISFLKKPYRDIFQKILDADPENPYVDESNCLILKECSDSYWKVFSPDERLLAHAIVDHNGVVTGTAYIQNFHESTAYDGEWENSLPDGEGKLFEVGEKERSLLKEGTWRKGEFIEGITYKLIPKVFAPGDQIPAIALDAVYDFKDDQFLNVLALKSLYTEAYLEEKEGWFKVLEHTKTDLRKRIVDESYVMIECLNLPELPLPVIDTNEKIREVYQILQSLRPDAISKFEEILQQRRAEVKEYYKQLLKYQYLEHEAPRFSLNFVSNDGESILPLEVELQFPKELIIMQAKDIENEQPNLEGFEDFSQFAFGGSNSLSNRLKAVSFKPQFLNAPFDEIIQVEEGIVKIEYLDSIFPNAAEKETSKSFVIFPLKAGTFYVRVDYFLPVPVVDFIKIEVIE